MPRTEPPESWRSASAASPSGYARSITGTTVPAVFVGVLSAVGGSILRDLLLNRPIALMHVGSLYAVAAVVGCGSLAIMLDLGVEVFVAASICVALTFGLRVLAVAFNWTLPEQRAIERLPRIRRR